MERDTENITIIICLAVLGLTCLGTYLGWTWAWDVALNEYIYPTRDQFSKYRESCYLLEGLLTGVNTTCDGTYCTTTITYIQVKPNSSALPDTFFLDCKFSGPGYNKTIEDIISAVHSNTMVHRVDADCSRRMGRPEQTNYMVPYNWTCEDLINFYGEVSRWVNLKRT